MKRIIAMMLALMMVFALCACGNDSSNDDKTKDDVKTLVVGIDPEYPPYAYMGNDGKYTGFDVETAQAVCDARLEGGVLRSQLGSEARSA